MLKASRGRLGETKPVAPGGLSLGEPPPHAGALKEVLSSGTSHPCTTHTASKANLKTLQKDSFHTSKVLNQSPLAQFFPSFLTTTLKLFPAQRICWWHLKGTHCEGPKRRKAWLGAGGGEPAFLLSANLCYKVQLKKQAP